MRRPVQRGDAGPRNKRKGGERRSVLERWTPFRDLELMDQRVRRLFPTLLPPVAPATDIIETKDEIVFEPEVPGYEEKEASTSRSAITC